MVVAALVVGSLAGLGVARAVPVGSVPAGDLDRFSRQHLDWHVCGDDALDKAGAQCTEVTVPLNYVEPQGRTITVAISRLSATDPAKRRGIMLTNPGGPGAPGLGLPLYLAEAMAPDVRDRYDLIGMDPRGIGRSAPVHCGWPIGLGLQSAGVDLESFGESVATQADLAARCQTAEHDKLPYITTRNTARDMDVIRGALGEQKISYLGGSYGTYLGAVYTQMFGDRTDRVVLDSAIDPRRYPVGLMQDIGAPDEAALDAWADRTAARHDEYRLGVTRAEVRATVTTLIRQAARTPIRIGSYDLDDHWIPVLLHESLSDQRRYDELASQVRLLADAAAGHPVQPTPELEQFLALRLTAKPQEISGHDAVWCGDVAAPRDPDWYWRNIEASRATQPVFGPYVNNITSCAFWPAPVEAPTIVQNSAPTLILQATGDTRAPYQEGVDLHRALTGSRLITLQDVRVHGIYGHFPNRCVADTVDTYLRDGTLPATDLTCHAD
ncbi:alpha/beta hydrolase [Nocardia sp. NPDC051570]|uniref:alpha/beta hydrolase n=1 Tax=Nocardia sp. NPDC051570 TaxID=3364324 RepID=UPI0037A6DF66